MEILKKHRKTILIISDIMLIFLSYILTTFLMTENSIFFTKEMINQIFNTAIISVFIYQIIFSIFDVYQNITRYENGNDYIEYILLSCIVIMIVSLLKWIINVELLTYKIIILSTLITSIALISYRVIARFILTNVNNNYAKNTNIIKKNLLIIGAGEASREIIKTIKTKMKDIYHIVGLIDDNPNKRNGLISGIRVLADRYGVQEICKKNNVDIIFFSIANINNQEKKEIISICQETGAKLRILPSTTEIIKNKTVFNNLRDVNIEDILGREPIILDNQEIEKFIEGQVVLITGGGGSIGSELCRQIVNYNPSKLVIFDIYENNLYNIQMELQQKQIDKKVEIIPIVGSVRDVNKLDNIFEQYKPYIVFHAAAHKHVPLMEINPLEAIKNNVIGTYNTVECANKHKVKRFVLISTDKAVNPTNIMGATKRICEMIIQAKNQVSDTEFVAVRFGNVLGSNGSVVPLFKKQIEAGGPITVTHKDITRFFMTIPEAVGLILQATTYAKGGEIFVLDMGHPVKIYDLAISIIKLSGLEPDVDIPIEITGLRPGEKLYEELLMEEEGLRDTAHNKIFIGKLQKITNSELESKIEILRDIIKDETIELFKIKQTLKEIVPTYKEPEQVNEIQNIEIEEDKKETINSTVKNIKKIIINGGQNQEVNI